MNRLQIIKRLLIGAILLGLVCLANNNLKAQDPLKGYVNSGGKVSLPKSPKKGSSAKYSGYVLESDIPNDSIWISKTGKYYVKRISKKTGNTYHKYLDIGQKPLKETVSGGK